MIPGTKGGDRRGFNFMLRLHTKTWRRIGAASIRLRKSPKLPRAASRTRASLGSDLSGKPKAKNVSRRGRGEGI